MSDMHTFTCYHACTVKYMFMMNSNQQEYHGLFFIFQMMNLGMFKTVCQNTKLDVLGIGNANCLALEHLVPNEVTMVLNLTG